MKAVSSAQLCVPAQHLVRDGGFNSLLPVEKEDRLVAFFFHFRAVTRVDEPDLERHVFLDDVICAQLAVCWAEIPRRDSFRRLVVE